MKFGGGRIGGGGVFMRRVLLQGPLLVLGRGCSLVFGRGGPNRYALTQIFQKDYSFYPDRSMVLFTNQCEIPLEQF